jgi:hypothetical protein
VAATPDHARDGGFSNAGVGSALSHHPKKLQLSAWHLPQNLGAKALVLQLTAAPSRGASLLHKEPRTQAFAHLPNA